MATPEIIIFLYESGKAQGTDGNAGLGSRSCRSLRCAYMSQRADSVEKLLLV